MQYLNCVFFASWHLFWGNPCVFLRTLTISRFFLWDGQLILSDPPENDTCPKRGEGVLSKDGSFQVEEQLVKAMPLRLYDKPGGVGHLEDMKRTVKWEPLMRGSKVDSKMGEGNMWSGFAS